MRFFYFALGVVSASVFFLILGLVAFFFLRRFFRAFSPRLGEVSIEELLSMGEPPTAITEKDRKAFSVIESYVDPLVSSLAERNYKAFFEKVVSMVREMVFIYRKGGEGDPILHLTPSEVATILWRAHYHLNNLLYSVDRKLGFLRVSDRSLGETKELIERSAEIYKKAGPIIKVARFIRPLFMAGEVGFGALNPVIALLLIIGSEAFASLASRLGKRITYEFIVANLARIFVVVVGLEAMAMLRKKRMLTYGSIKGRELVNIASKVRLSGEGIRRVFKEVMALEEIDSLQSLYLQRCLADGKSPGVVERREFFSFLEGLRDDKVREGVKMGLKKAVEEVMRFSLETDREKLLGLLSDIERRLGIRLSVDEELFKSEVAKALLGHLEAMGLDEDTLRRAIKYASARFALPEVSQGEIKQFEPGTSPFKLLSQALVASVSFVGEWDKARIYLKDTPFYSALLEEAESKLNGMEFSGDHVRGEAALTVLSKVGDIRFAYRVEGFGGAYIVLSDTLFLVGGGFVYPIERVRVRRALKGIREELTVEAWVGGLGRVEFKVKGRSLPFTGGKFKKFLKAISLLGQGK